jgi:hypothetical protein
MDLKIWNVNTQNEKLTGYASVVFDCREPDKNTETSFDNWL